MQEQDPVDLGQTLEDSRVGREVFAHFDERADDEDAGQGTTARIEDTDRGTQLLIIAE